MGGGGAPAGSSLPSDMLDFQVATFYIVNQDKYSVLVGFKHFYGSRNIVKWSAVHHNRFIPVLTGGDGENINYFIFLPLG